MAEIRRVVRKLETPHDAAIDEQLWPVNVALVVLGGFSLGVTLAYLRFDAPSWWSNAWTYVLLIPLIVGGAMAALAYINNKLFRRSMQLALIASAIFHLLIVVVSAESVIFTALSLDSKKKPILSDQATRIPVRLSPDLVLPEQSDEPRDYERPVETESPQAVPEPLAKREETEEDASPARPQPINVPEPNPTQQPALVKRPTTEQAAPRESSSLSKLSRNTQARDIAPSAAKISAERPAEQPKQDALAATSASVERNAPSTRPVDRATAEEPTASRQREMAAVTKRTTEPAPRADTAATATLPRQVNQPALTPKSQIDAADAPSVARRTRETEVTPNNTAAARRTTASPATERPSREPTTEPATQVAANGTRREVESTPQPDVAAAPTSVASRQPRVTPREAGPVTDVEAISRSTPAESTSPGPQATSVARSAAGMGRSATGSAPEAAPTDATEAGSLASGSVARARVSTAAAPNATAAEVGAPGTPRRAASEARLTGAATIPRGVEPAASPGTAANDSPDAGRLALSRAQAGVAGSGNSPNLDRGPGAGDSPALSASASARRDSATSSGAPDAALVPSTSAVRAQSRASQISPVGSQAETIAGAETGAAPQPGEFASASASLSQATGNAQRGEVSAAKGTADVDLGPSTIVAEGGSGRASGGGQPELSFDPRRGPGQGAPGANAEANSAATVARAARGNAPQAASATKVTEVPTAAGEEGSGGADGINAAPAAMSTQRLASASGGASGTAKEAEAAGSTTVGEAKLARAEAAAASPSETTLIGGGTDSPSKAAGGQTIPANAQAETVQLAGAAESGGGPEGVSLQAQGLAAAKTSGGATSQITEGAVGAAAGEEVVDAFGPQAAGRIPGGSRNVSPGREDGPSVSDLAEGGGPGKRSAETNVPAATSGKIDVPLVGPESAVAQADLDHGAATGVGRTASDAGEGLVVNIDAPEGVGGLGERLAADVGINSRLSRADSLEIDPQPTRFIGRHSGGIPAVSTASVVPTESYKKRAEGRSGRGSLPPQTEESVEAGLAFLARFQQNDGSWRLQGMEATTRADPQMVSDTAATAMAVLAFQGAGYNHREHKYASVVRNGLDYLVQNQKEDGDLFVPLDDQSNRSVWLYSHALASLALCEAYGMTQDPALQEPAQKSIDFIVAGQHKERGGWRYSPGVGSDTSVTGAMLVALRSAELAGLKVPKEVYGGVNKWLDQAQASPSQSHLYRYNPNAPDTVQQRQGRIASPTMTSLGLLMRLYLGWRRDDPSMIRGADYLKQNLPALGTSTDPQRDTYYWYYATQVMYHMRGEHWKEWHGKLHKLLLDTQIKDGPYAGSWNPRLPVPDRWGPHGGRLYVTALNLLSLEVPYRHLPTYEDTAE